MTSPVFIRRVTPKGTHRHKALWICRCGKEFVAGETDVKGGNTTSCGCARIGKRCGRITHGHYRGGKSSPTHNTWKAMIRRCTDPSSDSFAGYGGRGIAVYEPWRQFETFLADVGERPHGRTLDRYPDKNGNYEPSNVRWATPKQQSRNRNDLRYIRIGDTNMPLQEFCERYRSPINPTVVALRVKTGWLLPDALFAPIMRRGRPVSLS